MKVLNSSSLTKTLNDRGLKSLFQPGVSEHQESKAVSHFVSKHPDLSVYVEEVKKQPSPKPKKKYEASNEKVSSKKTENKSESED